jgi:hypothetical protein
MKERLIGLLLVAVGVLLGYLCVYQPLASAARGEPKISISLKGAILAPLCLIGVMYLALGPHATTIMGTRERPKPAAYFIAIGTILLGIGLYIWLRSTLQGYGYDFHGRF